MYSYGLTLNAENYRNLFSSSSGVLSVPVSPSAVIYSQFEHIHGIPASSNQEGVPVNRIRILNTLIGQLVNLKKTDETSANSAKQEFANLSEDQKDVLINLYQQQIKQTVSVTEATKPQNYGFAGLLPETGSVFNILA